MTQKPVILFDGICNLCEASVLFIIRRDPAGRFLFASLQSGMAQTLLKPFDLEAGALQSFLLIKDGRLFEKSDAAVEITRDLHGLWKLGVYFKFLPRFIRDRIYDWIAGNRYLWFGRKTVCMVPTEDIRSRFLDNSEKPQDRSGRN